jgi:hypothetical protein
MTGEIDTHSGNTCSNCGEILEPGFELCWNCGSTLTGQVLPGFSPVADLHTDNENESESSNTTLFVIAAVVASCSLVLAIMVLHAYSAVPSWLNLVLMSLPLIISAILIGLFAGLFSSAVTRLGTSHERDAAVAPGDPVFEEMVCPNCFRSNPVNEHFCINCATPLTAHATIDPLGQVYSAGDTFRKATEKPPNFLAVLGIWLLFAPLAVSCLYALRDLSGAGFGTGLVSLLYVSLFTCIYIAILYKITTRYYANRRKKQP